MLNAAFNIMGMFQVTFEGFEIFDKLSNTANWDTAIKDINYEIVNDINVEIDSVLGQNVGYKDATYSIEANKLHIVLAKNNKDNKWWFNNQDTTKDWMFLASTEQETRVKAGDILRLKYAGGLIPKEELYKQMWWMKQGKPLPNMANQVNDTVQDSELLLKKNIGNIITNKYNTLVGRIIKG